MVTDELVLAARHVGGTAKRNARTHTYTHTSARVRDGRRRRRRQTTYRLSPTHPPTGPTTTTGGQPASQPRHAPPLPLDPARPLRRHTRFSIEGPVDDTQTTTNAAAASVLYTYGGARANVSPLPLPAYRPPLTHTHARSHTYTHALAHARMEARAPLVAPTIITGRARPSHIIIIVVVVIGRARVYRVIFVGPDPEKTIVFCPYRAADVTVLISSGMHAEGRESVRGPGGNHRRSSASRSSNTHITCDFIGPWRG